MTYRLFDDLICIDLPVASIWHVICQVLEILLLPSPLLLDVGELVVGVQVYKEGDVSRYQ